jgi:polyhydroxybutyrate depolymerase
MRRPLLTALLLLTCACRAQAGDPESHLTHDGLDRTYTLHVPPQGAKATRPLVIALHGGGGTAAGMPKLMNHELERLADKEDFLVVYPDGIDKHWNDGRPDTPDKTHREKTDDVGFIASLIDVLARDHAVDPKRVYVTGISNGAMMTHRLAADLPGKIAAIAPIAGSVPVGLTAAATAGLPMPVLLMNGTEDPLVPYEGGDVKAGILKRGKVVATSEVVKIYCARNHATKHDESELPGKDDGTQVFRERWLPEGKGAPVILYRIEGGGHTWPGGEQYLPAFVIGRTTRHFSACEVMWEFFKERRRDPSSP